MGLVSRFTFFWACVCVSVLSVIVCVCALDGGCWFIYAVCVFQLLCMWYLHF